MNRNDYEKHISQLISDNEYIETEYSKKSYQRVKSSLFFSKRMYIWPFVAAASIILLLLGTFYHMQITKEHGNAMASLKMETKVNHPDTIKMTDTIYTTRTDTLIITKTEKVYVPKMVVQEKIITRVDTIYQEKPDPLIFIPIDDDITYNDSIRNNDKSFLTSNAAPTQIKKGIKIKFGKKFPREQHDNYQISAIKTSLTH